MSKKNKKSALCRKVEIMDEIAKLNQEYEELELMSKSEEEVIQKLIKTKAYKDFLKAFEDREDVTVTVKIECGMPQLERMSVTADLDSNGSYFIYDLPHNMIETVEQAIYFSKDFAKYKKKMQKLRQNLIKEIAKIYKCETDNELVGDILDRIPV